MNTLTSKQGDMVDELALRAYGRRDGTTTAMVLQANPALCQQPVRLPAGSRIDAKVVWDNSAANPNNPASPPRRVTWGEETQDEMGSIHFIAVAANTWEQEKLASFSKAQLRGAVGGMIVKEGAEALLIANKLKQAAEMDTNHDGKLSGDELPDFVKKSRIMNLIDKNGDGALDFEELKNAKSAFRALSQR
jgi:phage tail protein X